MLACCPLLFHHGHSDGPQFDTAPSRRDDPDGHAYISIPPAFPPPTGRPQWSLVGAHGNVVNFIWEWMSVGGSNSSRVNRGLWYLSPAIPSDYPPSCRSSPLSRGVSTVVSTNPQHFLIVPPLQPCSPLHEDADVSLFSFFVGGEEGPSPHPAHRTTVSFFRGLPFADFGNGLFAGLDPERHPSTDFSRSTPPQF